MVDGRWAMVMVSGDITDRRSLQAWSETVMAAGSGASDGVFFARFGPWVVRTPLDNIAGASVT